MLAVLSFLASPLGRLVGVAALVAAAGAAGFVKGDQLRARLDDAAGARAKIEFLQKQVDARDAAAKEDAARADADRATTTGSEDQTNAAIKGTSTAVCLDGNDADRLRALWGKSVPLHRKPVCFARPAAKRS
jgi:hypothetical protein